MNLTVEINNAEIRTLEWILELFAKPEIWSPYMIEMTIRAYRDKLQQSNESYVNEMKSRNDVQTFGSWRGEGRGASPSGGDSQTMSRFAQQHVAGFAR